MSSIVFFESASCRALVTKHIPMAVIQRSRRTFGSKPLSLLQFISRLFTQQYEDGNISLIFISRLELQHNMEVIQIKWAL